MSTLAAFLSKILMVLISDDDDRAVVLLATLKSRSDIGELILEVPDTFVLGGDFSLGLVVSQVAVCDATFGFLNGDELRLDIGPQSLNGGDMLIPLALDEADGLLGLSQLSLNSLVVFCGREEFLQYHMLVQFGDMVWYTGLTHPLGFLISDIRLPEIIVQTILLNDDVGAFA